MKIALFSHFNNFYSGGRIHAWFIAEGLAAQGHNLTVLTNQKPRFINDFETYPGHGKIKILFFECERFSNTPNDYELIIVVPDLAGNYSHYINLMAFLNSGQAKIMLVNFETVNWKNTYNKYSVESQLDNCSWEISKIADVILSSTETGKLFAKKYFKDIKNNAVFKSCPPPIHTEIADSVHPSPGKKNISIITRFAPRHKNGHRIIEMIVPEMNGYEVILVLGFGSIDSLTENNYKQAFHNVGASFTVKRRISEKEKFEILKNSVLSLFPSTFEGFGLPPVESLYCETPCVCFDLPVLKEINNEALIFANFNDFKDFRKKTSFLLNNLQEAASFLEKINYKGFFDEFSTRLNNIVIGLKNR